jgi:tRNA pseudouridine55 synthase
MDGVLIIDKPEGFTSHDVVARVRKILRIKRIGHTGTLDPFATGVLVVMIGRATRLAQFLDKDKKGYEAIVRLGYSTDTGDRTGVRNSEDRRQGIELKRKDLENVLALFLGETEQTPPMYSAKKIDGKKLYELARKGIEVERKPVRVNIYELEICPQPGGETFALNEDGTADLKIKVLCSAGTYIRVLAEDIGKKLKTGAHLAELRRTRAGKFELSRAVTLEKLAEIVEQEKLNEVLIPMNEAVSHLSAVKLSGEDITRAARGIKIAAEGEFAGGQFVRMCDEEKNLVAIGAYDKVTKKLQPSIVFMSADG